MLNTLKVLHRVVTQGHRREPAPSSHPEVVSRKKNKIIISPRRPRNLHHMTSKYSGGLGITVIPAPEHQSAKA